MQVVHLRELETREDVNLTAEQADALDRSGVVRVDRPPRHRSYDLTPLSRIGVVRVGDVQLSIAPKVPVERLLFLLGYARAPRRWHDSLVRLDPDLGLPEALAHSFEQLTTRALRQGPLKGYLTIDDSMPLLRGRIREADQLRHRLGRPLPLEVRYDEHSVDIAENRLLLAATLRLLRMPGVPAALRRPLQRIRVRLADVTPPVPGTPAPTWHPSRLNARYAGALALAELVLAGRSFEQRDGDVLVHGFLINMASLFEDFVTTALAEALRDTGGRASIQHPIHLDHDRRVPMKPDFVWLHDGRPVIVADAKYKAERPSGFPNADLYQLLAYCTALDLPVGHLVYAKGNEQAAEHTVRGSGARLVTHALDLDAAPNAVLAGVRRVAAAMTASPLLAPHAAPH